MQPGINMGIHGWLSDSFWNQVNNIVPFQNYEWVIPNFYCFIASQRGIKCHS